MSEQVSQHNAGDIVNGHMLGQDGQWHPVGPVSSTPTVPTPKKKGGKGKWIALAIVVLIIGGGIASRGGSGASTTTAGTATGNSSANASGGQDVANGPTTGHVGTTINYTDDAGTNLDITATKFVANAKPADEFSTPDAGKRFVSVQMRFTNKGDKVYDASLLMALKVADADGQTFDVSLFDSGAGAPFPSASVNIVPGKSSLGFVTFEVPKASKITEVQYLASSGVGDVAATWNVG
jgi:hypothetical protein